MECYLCGSDLDDHGPPLCGACNELTARGGHGLSLDRPPGPGLAVAAALVELDLMEGD